MKMNEKVIQPQGRFRQRNGERERRWEWGRKTPREWATDRTINRNTEKWEQYRERERREKIKRQRNEWKILKRNRKK